MSKKVTAPARRAATTPKPLPPRSPAPVAKTDPIKVEATMTGYYDHARRREGDVFTIANERAFSSRWMKRVDPRTPGSVSTAQDEIRRQHDEIRGGATAASTEATGDANPLGAD